MILQGLFQLVETLLQLYIYVMIAAAIFSWLLAFGVLDTRNRIVYRLEDFLVRATEPLLDPLRRVIPPLGGIDISFIIVFLVLEFIHNSVLPDLFYRLISIGNP